MCSTSRSTFRSAALACAASLALSLVPGRASAQACCSGASALTPGRLFVQEDALVGVQARAGAVLGSYDAGARYVRAPAASSETDLEQDLLGTVRVLGRGQLSLVVPFVETRRTAPGRLELGGGVGDAQLSARWDFTLAGDDPVLPGLALVVGVIAPTGRAPEAATRPLATDATGTGTWRTSAGVALEQAWGRLFANVTATTTFEAPRTALGLRVTRPLQLGLYGALGTTVGHDGALALTLASTMQGDAAIDGVVIPDSSRRTLRAGVASGLWIARALRMQLGAYGDVPLSGFGRNGPASVGATVMLVRSWS